MMKGLADSVQRLQEATERGKEGTGEGFEVMSASPYWIRGPAWIDTDSLEIVLDEVRAQPYYLYEGEGLLFDLAGLGEGDKAQNVLAFVRRYGLLWHGADKVGSGECRESLYAWFEAVGTLRFVMGLYRSLIEHTRSDSPEPIHSLGIELGLPDEIAEQATEEDYVNAAKTAVADMITMGLEGCRPGIAPYVGHVSDRHTAGEFVFSFVPSDLVGAAYAEFAMLVGTRAEIVECPGCGRLFSPESGKQKYHSKSCASTSRWRRWKENQDG